MRAPAIDFLVLGAQKCATSWLYYCLRDHRDIHLPAKKREVEYLGGEAYEKNGLAWYLALLDGSRAGQRSGDVSVEYLFDPRAPPLVREHAPAAKLIVSVRDPIDRAVSAYYWYARKGGMDVLPSIEQSLRRALAVTRANVRAARRPGEPQAELITRGLYDVQLERYLGLFPREQVFVTLYEDIRDHPRSVLEALYAFLDVAAGFIPRSLTRRPKQNSYSPTLVALERLAPRGRLVSRLADGANRLLGGSSPTRRPVLPPELVGELREVFRPHVDRTAALIRDLPCGNRPLGGDCLERWENFVGQAD